MIEITRMGISVRRLRCLAVVAAVACLAAPGAQAQSRREVWNKPTTPFRVIDNIYYVGTDGLASWLIVTPAGNILLDGALEESAPLIEKNIQALGFKLADIKYLLNSHAHFDHSGGLAQLKKDSGAQLIANEGDKSALEGGFYLGSEANHQFDSAPVKVDRTIADGEALTLGGVKLTANVTPGHTRGCTSWSMPVKDAGKTLQVLFYCSSSVAANRLFGPPQYPNIVADYETTFRKVKTLHVDVFLAPHPEIFSLQDKRKRLEAGGANPFIDPAAFARYVAVSEAEFREQLKLQKAQAGG